MSSLQTCALDHAFPWRYRDVSYGANGTLCCPSCRTELERVWSFRTCYTRASY